MGQNPWNGQLVDVDAFSPTLRVAERRWVVAPLTVVTGPLVIQIVGIYGCSSLEINL